MNNNPAKVQEKRTISMDDSPMPVIQPQQSQGNLRGRNVKRKVISMSPSLKPSKPLGPKPPKPQQNVKKQISMGPVIHHGEERRIVNIDSPEVEGPTIRTDIFSPPIEEESHIRTFKPESLERFSDEGDVKDFITHKQKKVRDSLIKMSSLAEEDTNVSNDEIERIAQQMDEAFEELKEHALEISGAHLPLVKAKELKFLKKKKNSLDDSIQSVKNLRKNINGDSKKIEENIEEMEEKLQKAHQLNFDLSKTNGKFKG